MKNMKLFLVAVFLSVSLYGISQPTILQPYQKIFHTDFANFFDVYSVEYQNDAAVLHCDFFNNPGYWVSLEPELELVDKSGDTYKLIRCEGITLGEKIFMPESGNLPFDLYFEPMKKDETEFFLTEKTGDKIEKQLTINLSPDNPALSKKIICTVKGTLHDRPYSNRIKLTKFDEDLRIKGTYITVKDGKFEAVMTADHEDVYCLNFTDEYRGGSWTPIHFFVENGTVEMELYPQDDSEKNIIKGSVLNEEFSKTTSLRKSLFNPEEFYMSMSKLNKEGLLYTKEYQGLFDNWDQKTQEEKNRVYKERDRLEKDNSHLTEQGKELYNKLQSLYDRQTEWTIEQAGKNKSLVSYYYVTHNILDERLNDKYKQEFVKLYQEDYKDRYPGHPNSQRVETKVMFQTNITKGGKYIDFTAPDFEGNPVKLSSHIEGKVALIDLWASWCGPCRRLSKSMIPIYEKYKDKGFTVLGVAREENVESAINAARKDKYPWLNLVELKDAGKIWEKYGAERGGGAVFLVDKDGTILAVHPEADEVEAILKQLLE